MTTLLFTSIALARMPKVSLPMSAASGIIKHEDKYFIIADTDATLYEIDEKGKLVNAHAIPWGELPEDPAARKKKKPDFESITIVSNGVLLIPSFSKSNRMSAAYFKINKEKRLVTPPEMIGLGDLGARLEKMVPALNIEGSIYKSGMLYLFQRGNGKDNVNGVFEIKVSANELLSGSKISKWPLKFKKIELGGGYTTTDAMDLQSRGFLLSGCIEDTVSTYDDGEVLGAALFLYKNGKVKKLVQFEKGFKIEGIVGHWNEKTKVLSLQMVDDPDDHSKTSFMYSFELKM